MAVTSVSVGPALRAWMGAGLTHILLEGDLAGFETAAKGLPGLEGASAPLKRPAAGTRALDPRAGSALPPMAGEGPAGPAVCCTGQGGQSPPQRVLKGVTGKGGALTGHAPAAPNVVFAGDFSLPPGEWPEPWRGWFAKITAAPVLWTYHELGADLTGIGRSRERSDFFKNLISELGLPKGSSVFWPSAMPVSADSPALVSHASLFAAGLRLLAPRAVVVLGDAALGDMDFHGAVGQFGQVMVEGKLLVRLPGIEELLRGDAQRSSAVSLLRALFVSINLGK